MIHVRLRTSALALLVALFLFHSNPASASVAFLMEEPYGHFGAWNPTGHAAIYFSNICAASPLKLRRCESGERGVVISRYHKVHHDDWLAIDLIPYLYAVDDVKDMPAPDNRDQENSLRNLYWQGHLQQIAPSKSGEAPKGNWTQLVGSAFDRTSHVFEVPSTTEQDDRMIAYFNRRTNKSHFNLFLHNCADFSRVVLNLYFPGAIRRNYVADFGFTTPKQVARCLVSYGKKHPELPVRQYVIEQTNGSIARSHRIRGVSESLVKTKRWLIPLIVVQPEVIGVSAIAYVSTGREHFEQEVPVFPVARNDQP